MTPESYRTPVPGVPLIPPDATLADVGQALDGQTGRLETANGRTADVIAAGERCEAIRRAMIEAAKPPPSWLDRLLRRA